MTPHFLIRPRFKVLDSPLISRLW